MFNLEKSISEWRQQMLAAGIKTPVPLEELEEHLRDEVARRVRTGLSEGSAFEFATAEMGAARTLNEEFMKVETRQERQWKNRIRFFVVTEAIVLTVMAIFILCRPELNAVERWQCLGALAVMTFSQIVGLRFIPSLFPVIRNKKSAAMAAFVFAVTGTAWFGAYVNFILPYFELTQGQLVVAVLWGMVPTIAFPALTIGLDSPKRSQPKIST